MKLKKRINLCWRILTFRPDNLYHHALRELPQPNDDMQHLMNQGLLEMVMVFSTQDHSGFSASYAQANLEKLLAFEPLRPLEGTHDEWAEVSEGLWQNKRCSRVFKDEDGRAYDIDGRVFCDSTGSYTNKNSRVFITFPYTPKTEYVTVEEKEKGE